MSVKKKKTTIKICCHACLRDMMGQTPPFVPVLALTMRVISSVRYDIAGSKGFLRNTRKKLDR